MMAYEYVPGDTCYQTLRTAYDVDKLLEWAYHSVWQPLSFKPSDQVEVCKEFYYTKTMQRIAMLRPELQAMTYDCVSRIDWDTVVNGCQPVAWHGDFNFGNIIYDGDRFRGIDWRGNFAGRLWGDRRYDVAKLLVGCVMHWDRVRRGDFSPWHEGRAFAQRIRDVLQPGRDVEMIAALTLLNSAPLHDSPLDEVLVVRAASWLEHLG
jgi:hypothetical protein